MMIEMADSAGLSTPVVTTGKSKLIKLLEIVVLIKTPPKTVPAIMEPTVNPSIQPFAATSFSGGRSSVRMPYLAGEYAAAPKPTMA